MEWSGEVKEGGGWRIFPEDGEKLPGRKKKKCTLLWVIPSIRINFPLGKRIF